MSGQAPRIGALVAVPTLDELATEPTKAAALPASVLQSLLCRCVTLQGALLGALVDGAAGGTAPNEPDTLLDVTAAAQRLGVSEDWLYRRSRKLAFTVRPGRLLRFSSEGIDRYIREHQQGGA